MTGDTGTIKVGTSGFSFPDWRGTIYPRGMSQKQELTYYQEELGFDILEVNASYYTLMDEKNVAVMGRKTKEGFEFIVKGYKGFTHDPFDDRLPEKPSIEKAMEDIAEFRKSLVPFMAKNKLGAVLLQFPVFFYPSKESEDYIIKCKKSLADIPLVIEFRNIEWSKGKIFDFLRENNLAYCAVDEPKLPRLMPFINEVTADIGYIRMHGRNKNWFNAPTSVRYDYLYSDGELNEFVPEAKKMADKAKKVYMLMNNCHAGKAVQNARRMKNLLGLPGKNNLLF